MIIKLKQKENLYLKNIPEVLNGTVSEKFVLDQLTGLYYSKTSSLGIEPFKISFGRGYGYYISANFFVGIIHFDETTLVIESDIPDLDLAKILYLASKAQPSESQTTGNVLDSLLSDEEELNLIDYFTVPFINRIQEIISNGIIKKRIIVEKQSTSIKGRLDIQKQETRSPAYEKFHLKTNTDTPNLLVNQILLKAIKVAKSNTKLDSLVPILHSLEEAFLNVEEIEIDISLLPIKMEQYSTVRRKDYEDTIILAEHIIFGFDPSSGLNFDLFPEYLHDLNKIFESYVMNSLNTLFKTGFQKKRIFTLGISPNDPPTEERFIELDGWYQFSNNVVIDAKNKYSNVLGGKESSFLPSNPDLFQQSYYALRTQSKDVVLVYPSTKKFTKPVSSFVVSHANSPTINFHCWALLITGNPRENLNAIKKLALFINDITK
ncbi:5-methylcytosine-specific restriction endonuclease McrBC regulatory subunit McrC [Paenibacillus jamilae]|nr:5-methylcytosine-specific restriction endonuclease McrBC regulatory subunit McrC [Paenibacillus jamilae]